MAQQVLDVALVLHQMSKMILSAPRSCSGNVTRRCRTLQVFRAQPLKKRHDLRLRCRKYVQNLCTSWHEDPPRNQRETQYMSRRQPPAWYEDDRQLALSRAKTA